MLDVSFVPPCAAKYAVGEYVRYDDGEGLSAVVCVRGYLRLTLDGVVCYWVEDRRLDIVWPCAETLLREVA